MNEKKHEYDVMYRKVRMRRLEKQWKNKQFNEITKIFVKPSESLNKKNKSKSPSNQRSKIKNLKAKSS